MAITAEGTGRPAAGAHVVLHRALRTSKGTVQAVLLCKRTLDAPTHPGHWSLFGGKRDQKDADIEDTAIREVREELGIELARDALAYLLTAGVFRQGQVFPVAYFSHPLDRDLDGLTLQRQFHEDEEGKAGGLVEGEGLGWFAAEEVHHLTVRPEDRIAITEFFRRNGM